MSKPKKSEMPVAAATACSACGGSGMGKPMYRPEIDKSQRDHCHTCKGTGTHAEDPVFLLEQTFRRGWYLEWWGDGNSGPLWTNDPAKAEKLTMGRAKYEQGMLREVTQIVRQNY